MPRERAHVIDPFENSRTEDVITNEDITFRDMLLSPRTLLGLDETGFTKPSPIQRKAIPLGRCGFDLIVQAKSGTGKTCVFTIIALEMIHLEVNRLQVLILSPTREISVQIKDVISAMGKKFEGLEVKTFIGGLPMESDKKNLQKCHIAVGSPGRVKHLIQEGLMRVGAIRLFILDEADKLMDKSFRADVSFIFLSLPERKQVIATSATYPKDMEDFLVQYMTRPTRISLGLGVFLKGVRQFVSVVPYHANLLNQTKIKEAELIRLLSNVSFKQCFVFSNYQTRVESICKKINKEGFPAVYISGSQSQVMRLKSLEHLKEFNCRVFVSTDLTSRGIDAENVNLVINMDVPHDSSTYMHRIGRAGRYGTQGLAVTIVQTGDPCAQFQRMLYEISGYDFQIHIFPPGKLNSDVWKMNESEFETLPMLNDEGETHNLIAEEEGKETKEEEEEEVVDEKVVSSKESKARSEKLKLFEELVAGFSKSGCELITFDEFVDLDKRFKETRTELEPLRLALKHFEFSEFSKEILSSLNSIRTEDLKAFEEKMKNPKESPASNSPKSAGQTENRDSRNGPTEEAKQSSDSDEKEKESNRDDSEDNTREEEEDCCSSDSSSCSSCDSYDDHYNMAVNEESYRKWYSQWQAQVKLINDYVKRAKLFRVSKGDSIT